MATADHYRQLRSMAYRRRETTSTVEATGLSTFATEEKEFEPKVRLELIVNLSGDPIFGLSFNDNFIVRHWHRKHF